MTNQSRTVIGAPLDQIASGGNPTEARYRTDAHAVVIGINRYQDPAIHDLRYARADAEAIYNVLTDPELGRFDPKNVQLLLDEKATGRNIRSAIGTHVPRRAKEQDTVYIYYAGHGAPVILPGAKALDGLEKYLVPFDAEIDDLRATGVDMEEIQKFFRWIDSRQVLFFIDSCYSGTAGGRTFEHPHYQHRAALTDEFLDGLAGDGRCVVTACGINEVSLESPEIGHGLFTYYLVEGLKGAADADKDGLVTMHELYDYVYEKVTEKARSLGGNMRPVQKGFVQGHVYLTRYETEAQKQARWLNDDARARFDANDLDEAALLWQQTLELVPAHEGAALGLDAIRTQKHEEQQKQAEAEREREHVLKKRQHVLLGHYKANRLPLAEYNRGMALLEKDADEMTDEEIEIREFLLSLTDGSIEPRVYLRSVQLISEVEEHTEARPERTPTEPEVPSPAKPEPRLKREDAAILHDDPARRSHAAPPSPPEPAKFRFETIIPGVGTETVRLDLTEQAVIARLGIPQEKVVFEPSATVSYRQSHFDYHHLGLSLLFRDGKLKFISFIGRRPKFDAYLGATTEGISVTSTEKEILAAYGVPETDGKHRQHLIYQVLQFTLKPLARHIVKI